MSDKIKKLLILAGILAAVCVIYFVVSRCIDNQNEKKASQAAEESEANRIWVTTLDGIRDISFEEGENQIHFVKKDDCWYEAQDENFPVDQTALQTLVDLYSSVEATRSLTGGDALSDYGLDTPALSIHLTDGSGKITSLYIGNKVNDEYYLKKDASEVVYTVNADIYSTLSGKSLYDFVQIKELPQITVDAVESISIHFDDQNYDFKKESAEASESESGESEAETEGSDHFSELASTIAGLSISGCVDYNAENHLENYGLKNPEMRISYTYLNDDVPETIVIYVGDMSSDGENYYILEEDTTAVYMIPASSIEGIRGYLE